MLNFLDPPPTKTVIKALEHLFALEHNQEEEWQNFQFDQQTAKMKIKKSQIQEKIIESEGCKL